MCEIAATPILISKALPGISFVFSATCIKKPVFSKRDLLSWKVPTRLYWDLLTDRRSSQPVTISKKWKNPSLIYIGKGPQYRPFHDFRPVLLAYRPQAQISNSERAQALLLYVKHSAICGSVIGGCLIFRNPRAGISKSKMAAEASVSLFQMPMYPFSFFWSWYPVAIN
jgi:hypothetical protein